MKNTIVLQTEGRHDSVHYISVLVFNDTLSAEKHCEDVNTGIRKHWKKAEIVNPAQVYELTTPTDDQ